MTVRTMEDAVATVNRLYERLIARRPDSIKFEDYYEGRQKLRFATKEWRNAHANRYSGFADNWCRPVADAEGERLDITGVRLGRDYEDLARTAWEWWRGADMEAQSSQGLLSTLITTRSHVLVWGDDEGPTATWEHSSFCEVEVDPENRRRRTAGLKTWLENDRECATLYTPEWVFKFQRRRQTDVVGRSQFMLLRGDAGVGGWEPRETSETGDDRWPIANPLGVVPLVEIPNRPLLMSEPVSEIAGVVSMQDAINLLWAYLFVAADYASMEARVVTGQGAPKIPVLDKDGKVVGSRTINIEDLRERRTLYLENPQAKIDAWAPAKLDPFLEVIREAVGHVASQTRTPPTYLVSQVGLSNVNAEGLKASEIGLVRKVREFQTTAAPQIREVFRLMALAAGDEAAAKVLRGGTVTWANPEIRSEAQLTDALQKKASMGYPLEYLLELDGLDQVDIDRVMSMRDTEAVDPQLIAAARGMEGDAHATGVGGDS